MTRTEEILKWIENSEEIDTDFADVRKKVQSAVDASSKSITFEEALKQIKKYDI